MVALALLFVIIIGILPIITWLLKKYFEVYSSLHITENKQLNKLQSQLKSQKNTNKAFKKEINTLINKRLNEMKEKFPTEQAQEEPSEILIVNFKKMFHSTLNLLKTKKY